MAAGTHPSSMLRRALAACFVAGAVALTACGGSTRDKAATDPSCDQLAAAFQQPETALTFRAAGASRSELDATVRILCARLAASDTPHKVRREASDRVVVELPASSALARAPSSPFTSRASSSVFGDGKLAFYDWEANVVGPDGKPAPRDRKVTGGPGPGRAGSLSLYDAVLRASRRPAVVEADNAVAGSRFYAVDAKAKRVLSAVPAAGRAQALEALAPARRAAAKVYEVKADTVVVRADDKLQAAGEDAWYVLRDDVALRGDAIVRPRAQLDRPPASGSGEPAVSFEFTPEGRRLWTRLVDDIVERGRRNARPADPVELGFQHFAIVLDDRILAVPFMDFRITPEGIDPNEGSRIVGGMTMASARQLAALLAGGELPRSLEAVGSS